MKYLAIVILALVILVNCSKDFGEEATEEYGYPTVTGDEGPVKPKITFIYDGTAEKKDFERIYNLFWELCQNYNSGLVCSQIEDYSNLRIHMGGCLKFRAAMKATHRLDGITIARSEGSSYGIGEDVYLCNDAKETVFHELSHVLLYAYQRSYLGISPEIHEACAINMSENVGAKWKTWKEINQ